MSLHPPTQTPPAEKHGRRNSPKYDSLSLPVLMSSPQVGFGGGRELVRYNVDMSGKRNTQREVYKMRHFLTFLLSIFMLAACSETSQNGETLPSSAMMHEITLTTAPTETPVPLQSLTPVPFDLILKEFPLAVGTIWKYSAAISYQDPNDYMKLITWNGLITDKVIDRNITSDGKIVFTVQEDMDPLPPQDVWRQPGTFEYTVFGNGVFRRGTKVYQWPLKDDLSWRAFEDFEYEMSAYRMKEVETPYGKLENCYVFLIATNPDTSIETFCPGIGFVEHSYRHHGTPQDEEFKLIDFILGD